MLTVLKHIKIRINGSQLFHIRISQTYVWTQLHFIHMNIFCLFLHTVIKMVLMNK